MKTTHSDNIVVIGGSVETSKTAPPNAFVLRSKRQDRRYRKCITIAERTPSACMKHQHGGRVSREGMGTHLPCGYW